MTFVFHWSLSLVIPNEVRSDFICAASSLSVFLSFSIRVPLQYFTLIFTDPLLLLLTLVCRNYS